MAFRSGIDPRYLIAEVRRLVRPGEQEAAIAILNGIRGSGADVVWLQLAALHLSGGRVDLMPQWVELANIDDRDLMVSIQRHLDPLWDQKYQWPWRSELADGR